MFPTWRMMMFPVTTCSPPYFFTPRYCGFESRPFFVEPVPFLCAFSTTSEPRIGAAVLVGMETTRAPPTEWRAAIEPVATEVKPMREFMMLRRARRSAAIAGASTSLDKP